MRNGEATILKCLQSILNQKTNITFEVIVVNNASTDKSLEVIKNLNIRIIYEPRIGRSHARNAGLNLGRGDWISFIDCDVELEDNWLEEIYHKVNSCDIFDGGQGKITPIGLQSSLFEKYRYELIKFQTSESFCHLDSAKIWPTINSAACFYRRSRLLEVVGFDPILNTYEDIDLCWRLWVSGSSFVSVPNAHASVYWDKGTFLSYLIRYFHMGKGSFILQQLWGKESVIPKFSSHLLRTEDTFLKSFDLFRVLAFAVGIIFSLIFQSRKIKEVSHLHRIRKVKLSRHKKHLCEIEGRRYLFVFSPFVRIVFTSKHILVAELVTGKYKILNHNEASFDFTKIIWLNKNALINAGYLNTLT